MDPDASGEVAGPEAARDAGHTALLQCWSAGLRGFRFGVVPFGETILLWWSFVARGTETIVSAPEDGRDRLEAPSDPVG